MECLWRYFSKLYFNFLKKLIFWSIFPGYCYDIYSFLYQFLNYSLLISISPAYSGFSYPTPPDTSYYLSHFHSTPYNTMISYSFSTPFSCPPLPCFLSFFPRFVSRQFGTWSPQTWTSVQYIVIKLSILCDTFLQIVYQISAC